MTEKTIVEILMERDDIDRQEAIDMVTDCRTALEAFALGQPAERQVFSDEDDIIQELLGLEPDYLIEILNFEGK